MENRFENMNVDFNTEEDEVECITGIDYFTDEQDPMAESQYRQELPQPFSIQQQPSNILIRNVVGVVANKAQHRILPVGISQLNFSGTIQNNHLEQQAPVNAFVSFSSASSSSSTNTTDSIRQSVGLLNRPIEAPTHGCKLCKRKFCNPMNLLRHMKEFHQVDTDHIIERRAASQNSVPQGRFITIAPKASTTSGVPGTASTSGQGNASGPSVMTITPDGAISFPNIITDTSGANYVSVLQHSVASEATDAENIIPSTDGRLTSFQIKQAEELIVVDAVSFYCSKCFLRFGSRILAENHTRIVHLGEKPYFCDICNGRFKSEMDDEHKCTKRVGTDTSIDRISTSSTAVPITSHNSDSSRTIPTPPFSSEITSTSTDFYPPPPYDEATRIDNRRKSYLNSRGTGDESVESSCTSASDQYVSTTGVLTPKQIAFAERMIDKVKDETGRYTCRLCGSTFSQMHFCRNHIRHMHLMEHYSCPVCSERFAIRRARDQHKLTHSVQQFKNICTVPTNSVEKRHETHVTDPVGIHVNLINSYIVTYAVRDKDGFKCKKCKKSFKAFKYCLSHVRQVHFGKSNQCISCGLYFEENLHVHRLKCNHTSVDSPKSSKASVQKTAPDLPQVDMTTDVGQLTHIMRNSVQSLTGSQGVEVFTCLLCSASFDKRMTAESHLWIEHIRTEWAQTCGHSNVDDIYLQYLQTVFSQNSGGYAPPSVVSNSRIKSHAVIANHSEMNTPKQYGNKNKQSSIVDEAMSSNEITPNVNSMFDETGLDNEEEVLFDPAAVAGASIFVEEAGGSCQQINGSDEEYDISAALQCKVEIDEGPVDDERTTGCDNSNDSPSDTGFHDDIPVNPSRTSEDKNQDEASVGTSRNILDRPSDLANSDIRNSEKNPVTKPALTEAEIQQLNIKSLQFIKEKQGSFVCTLCQRVSKLRRNLVEHVRKVHLCGEEEDIELTSASVDGNIEQNKGNPTFYDDVITRAVLKYLPETAPTPTSTPQLQTTVSNIARPVHERASRFVRHDGPEFYCTVCTIRSTKIDRLIRHISIVHFGENDDESLPKGKDKEEVIRCPGCKKVMPDRAFKARHMPRCTLAQHIVRRLTTSTSTNTKPKSVNKLLDANYRVGADGVMRKKLGRPFKNPPPLLNVNVETHRTNLAEGSKISSIQIQKPSIQSETLTIAKTVIPASSKQTTRVLSPAVVAQSVKATVPSTVGQDTQPLQPARCKTPTASSPITHPAPVKPVTAQTLQKPSEPSKPESKEGINAEDLKKMIIPWSIGGKYSFFKCKECSVLFTKYANAEIHVRNVHMDILKKQTEEPKISTTTPEQPKTGAGKPSRSEPPPVVNLESEHSSSEDEDIVTKKAAVVKKGKGRKRAVIESDTSEEEDESNVYEAFSPSITPPISDDEVEAEITPEKVEPVIEETQKNESVSSTAIASVTRNLVLSKLKPFSAFQAGDVIKKYAQRRKVSKALTSLTSKEFTDSQKFIKKTEKNGYDCRGCGEHFPRLNAISRHVRQKHFVERPYHCLLCDERFFHLNEFENHKSGCTGDTSKLPTKTPKLLAQSGSDSVEKKRTAGTHEDIVPDLTGKTSEDAEEFVEILKKKRHRCKICKLILKGGYKNVLKHIKNIHFNLMLYECGNCQEKFRYAATHAHHVKVCSKSEVPGTPTISTSVSNESTNNDQKTPHKSSDVESTDRNYKYKTDSTNDAITFRCRLCHSVSSDKPLFKYHLVSVHYDHLAKMSKEKYGTTNKVFDMVDEILEDLIVLPKMSKAKKSKAKKAKKNSSTKKPIEQKISVPLTNTEEENKSQADSSDEEISKDEKADDVLQSNSQSPVVHSDEKQLLESLPKPDTFNNGDFDVPTKQLTVRIEPMIIQGELPVCLIEAARSLCSKYDNDSYQCKNCGRCFATQKGCFKHARIRHYGERRYECPHCHKFFPDALKPHRERCQKKHRTS